MKKLRIGILTHNYPVNSGERKDAGIFIYDFAHELSKKADVFVFCPDFGGSKEKYKKVPVMWFDWEGGNEKFGNWQLFNPVYIYKFFKLIYIGQKKAIEFAKENKIDYCLSCWTLPSAIFGLRVKQALKIPYASWSLGSDVNKYVKIPILGQLINLALRKADKRYANSFALINKVKEISQKECSFLPAITNFEKGARNIKSKGKIFRFLFVGRLERIKGPDILIDAVSNLLEKQKNFEVNILGDGTMMRDLKNKTANNMNSIVNFLGWADQKKVSNFMSISNCLVIPSRNESLPLVLIEAARRNLPVIATRVGDCERMIKKYNIGISVQKENPDRLSSAMSRIMKDKGYKRKRPGFKKLSSDFSQEKTVDVFLSNI